LDILGVPAQRTGAVGLTRCNILLHSVTQKDFRSHPSRGLAVKFGFNQPFKFDEKNRTFYSIAYVSNSAAEFGNSEQGKAR
jgi:hypothetical protein